MALANRQDVKRENVAVRSMIERLWDFTRKNPLIFIGSKTSKDPQEFVDKVHKILVSTGATNTD